MTLNEEFQAYMIKETSLYNLKNRIQDEMNGKFLKKKSTEGEYRM